MALTALDPRTALIVIDLQKGIVSRQTVHPAGDIVKRASALADAFRIHDLPVVLVNVAGGAPGRTEQHFNRDGLPPDWTELVPELNPQPKDHRVTKKTWGAFTNTGLDAHLKAQEVTQVVLAGVATSIGVESTARQAFELGFNVTLATDAMTDATPEAHENSISRIFPKLGETAAAQDIIARLSSRSL